MPFADWDVYNPANYNTINIDVSNVIIGVGSLRFDGVFGLTKRPVNMVPKVTSDLPHSLLKGKMRQLVKVVALGGGDNSVGIAALQSVRDITVTGTSAYLAEFVPVSNLVRLSKITNGLPGAFTTLASAAFSIVLNGIYALEFEWVVDLIELGGTRLIVRTGTALDFSDLTQALSFTDTSSPLQTTAGEGPFADFGTSQAPQWRIDQTRLTLRL